MFVGIEHWTSAARTAASCAVPEVRLENEGFEHRQRLIEQFQLVAVERSKESCHHVGPRRSSLQDVVDAGRGRLDEGRPPVERIHFPRQVATSLEVDSDAGDRRGGDSLALGVGTFVTTALIALAKGGIRPGPRHR